MAAPHWTRDGVAWVTEEQMAGISDFRIERTPGGYRMKWRSSRRPTLHDTLSEAKAYALSIWVSQAVPQRKEPADGPHWPPEPEPNRKRKMSIHAQPANRASVRAYLLAAYDVTEKDLDAALNNPAAKSVIAAGESDRSFAGYIADQVVDTLSIFTEWDERPDFDPDAEDDPDMEGL